MKQNKTSKQQQTTTIEKLLGCRLETNKQTNNKTACFLGKAKVGHS